MRSEIYYTVSSRSALFGVDYRGSRTLARCPKYRDISECKFLACPVKGSFPCMCHTRHCLSTLSTSKQSPKTEYAKKALQRTRTRDRIFFTMYQWDVPAHDVQNVSEQSKGQLACPTVYLRGIIEVKNAHVQMNKYIPSKHNIAYGNQKESRST